MKLIRTIPELRAALVDARRTTTSPLVDARRTNIGPLADARRTIVGLVPTMGAFHEGHLSLMRRARAECNLVVVSLFVNPTQFNDPRDLGSYPRDEASDVALADAVGTDILFAPTQSELYPQGFATRVSVSGVGEVLEGAHRGPSHFEGVATVVVKLLNIVAPDVAYFGQKDAQQTVVIKRLVRDLDIPVRIEVCPTVRAPDGLALSSRNSRLSAAERPRAAALYRSLRAAERAISCGERDPEVAIAIARQELALSGVEPDYFQLVDPESFAPVAQAEGDVLAAVAASIDGIRLIDNLLIHVPAGTHTSGVPAYPDRATVLASH
jgi:pantoate--beta-alanine ligase